MLFSLLGRASALLALTLLADIGCGGTVTGVSDTDAGAADATNDGRASSEAAPPDGAAACPPLPRSIACGDAGACTGTDDCCQFEQTCSANYCNDKPVDAVPCDDANDCPAGQVCCEDYNKGVGATEVSCAVACSWALASQRCMRDCECLGGKSCVRGHCQ